MSAAPRWRKPEPAPAKAGVPLSFAPGEAYQFDWSHEVVLINGTTVTVKVAHVRLCYSRMLFVRAYPRETQEMVFDAHNRAFAFFKGTCTRGIYDNMKTAVETVLIGKNRQFNRRFLRMCGHYLVEPVACTPASGWEKGQSLPLRRRGSRTRLDWCASVSSRAAAGGERRLSSGRAKRGPGGGAERLAARPVRRLRQGAQASRVGRLHDLAVLRGGAPPAGTNPRPIRRVPRDASLGLEDLSRAVRQQQVLGRLARRGAAG